jgi:hypothetical protein
MIYWLIWIFLIPTSSIVQIFVCIWSNTDVVCWWYVHTASCLSQSRDSYYYNLSMILHLIFLTILIQRYSRQMIDYSTISNIHLYTILCWLSHFVQHVESKSRSDIVDKYFFDRHLYWFLHLIRFVYQRIQ